jgi:hypothetical protein
MDPSELLRGATAKKNAGDINGAVQLLREAISFMDQEKAQSRTEYPIEHYLRLPLYLQEAGRPRDSWVEFNNLLFSHPEPGNTAQTYDKMRLFLQREGSNDRAITFGIFSIVCGAINYYQIWKEDLLFDGRPENRTTKSHNEKQLAPFSKEMFEGYISKKNIEMRLTPLLKKAKKTHLLDRLQDILMDEMKKIPAVDFNEINKRIAECWVKDPPSKSTDI